jgi:hypothetical protein
MSYTSTRVKRPKENRTIKINISLGVSCHILAVVSGS